MGYEFLNEPDLRLDGIETNPPQEFFSRAITGTDDEEPLGAELELGILEDVSAQFLLHLYSPASPPILGAVARTG